MAMNCKRGNAFVSRNEKRQNKCLNCQLVYEREYFRIHPWMKHLSNARIRCAYRTNKSYKYYGARGIRCIISGPELEAIWFRDNARELKRPSLDRINPDGHYTKENCRFVELQENSRCHRTKAVPKGEKVDREGK